MTIDINRALLMAQGLELEVNAAIRYRNRSKGGQQVPFHSPFAQATPSCLNGIKWWTREIRNALGDERREIEDV